MIDPGTAMEFESYALSRQQARAWELAGRGPTIDRVVQVVAPLPGSNSPDSIARAVAAAVARHEILRTTFAIPTGRASGVQVVHRSLAAAVRTATEPLATVLTTERRPFSLDASPLRVALVGAGTADAVLVVTLSGLAADAASAAQLAAELVDPARAVDEPLQYADYAAWQDEQLAAPTGSAPTDSAPTDSAPTDSAPTDSGAVPATTRFPMLASDDASTPRALVTATVECDADALRAAAQRLGAPDADVVLAAWFAWLARADAATDVTVAVLHDGRANPDTAGALGPFSRYTPTTVEVAPDTTFAALVAATRAARSAPPDAIELVPDAAVSIPAFGALDGFAAGTTVTAALTADEPDTELRWLGHAIELRVTDALPPAALAALARSVSTVLAAAIADVETMVGDLPTLAPADAADADAHAAGPTSVQPVRDAAAATFVECFDAQVARTPDRDAVRAGAARLTYAALDARANQLARVLATRGAGRGARVGVLLDRSIDALVAILGVIKAGAAYVPLNPEHPVARLAHQLDDAGASIVVTVGAHAPHVPDAAELVVLDADLLDGVDAGRLPTTPEITPDDAIYVLYTSGSTGVPKGVVVTHANLVSYATTMAQQLASAAGITAGEPLRCGSVTSISTDLGNTSIFAALVAGGCADLVAADIAMDPFAFAEHRRAHPVEVLKITPSHLGALVRAAGAAVLPERVLVIGGEALSWDLVATVRALSPGLTIMNHYGPTETTVGACTFVVPTDPLPWRTATVPIGRPLPGVTADVVDRGGRRTGIGVPGELLIGGAGVAAGYCDAVATHARFAADARRPDARVYRTGDVVRRLPDGALEFLGRADDQVKIRGYRVEPREVERLLLQDPSVRDAAVVARTGTGDDDTALVAYVVADGGDRRAELDPVALRASLAARLPGPMIPAAFVVLDALPLTASGKLDRRALPDHHHTARPTRAGPRRDPSTETEALLAAVWAEILGVDAVGVDDDFFALGGHSLLATQVIAQTRRAVGVELPLYALFSAPTVAQLATVVDELAAGAGGDGGRAGLSDDAELAALLDGMSDEEIERLLAEE